MSQFMSWLKTVVIKTLSSNSVAQQSQAGLRGMRTAAGLENAVQIQNNIFNFKIPETFTNGWNKRETAVKRKIQKSQTPLVDHVISGQQCQAERLGRQIKTSLLCFLIIGPQSKDLNSCSTMSIAEQLSPESLSGCPSPPCIIPRFLPQSSATADGNFQLGMCFRGNKEFPKVTLGQ